MIRLNTLWHIFCTSSYQIETQQGKGHPSKLIEMTVAGHCCRTLSPEESHCKSMRLDGLHEQAITRPLSHDELVQLRCLASQVRVFVDLAGRGHDLARAA